MGLVVQCTLLCILNSRTVSHQTGCQEEEGGEEGEEGGEEGIKYTVCSEAGLASLIVFC